MPSSNTIRTTILSNGLTVLTERMPHVRSITTAVYIRKGARHDSMELNGLAHFVEHMVFTGTATRNARQISLDIGDLGGEFNAFTTHDAVVFQATVLDTKVGGALDILSDLLLNPSFDPEQINRERGVVELEINERHNDPASQAFNLYLRTQWPTSSFGLPIGGGSESIHSFTHETLSNYAAENFTGRNMVVVAAGNLQHDDLVADVVKYFGNAPAGEVYVRTPAAKPSSGIGLLSMPVDQIHLVMGFPAPPQGDPRYYQVHLLAALLGQGSCSRFYHSVRERKGLVYSINAEYFPSESDGYFGVYATTDRSRESPVRELILQEFHRLKTEDALESEIHRFKEQLLFNAYIGAETSVDRARMLAGQFLALGRHLSQEERHMEILRITAKDLREVAAEVFDSSRMVTVAVGDVQQQD